MEPETSKSEIELGKQPDLAPPPVSSAPAPSLWLYGGLALFALALVGFAFSGGGSNWPSLFLNLATEVVGAVIILVLVDRRLRQRDVEIIRGLPENAKNLLDTVFPRHSKHIRSYCRIVERQVERTSLPFYLHRPEISQAVLREHPDGLLVVGPAGIGKSTEMLVATERMAREASVWPRTSRVPIMSSLYEWDGGDMVDYMRKAMQRFYPVPDRTFARLLEEGRIVFLMDGLDEVMPEKTEAAVEAISAMRRMHPDCSTILSSRPIPALNSIEPNRLPMTRIQIPGLTQREAARLLELRRSQMADLSPLN